MPRSRKECPDSAGKTHLNAEVNSQPGGKGEAQADCVSIRVMAAAGSNPQLHGKGYSTAPPCVPVEEDWFEVAALTAGDEGARENLNHLKPLSEGGAFG